MSTTLLHGDCCELLKSIPDKSIDLILTDPPYFHPHMGGKGTSELAQRASKLKQDILFMSESFDYDIIFNEFLRVCRIPNMLIFCSNAQISAFMRFFEERELITTLLEWVKLNPIPTANGNYLSDVEYCVFVRAKGATFNNDVPYDYKRKAYIDGLVSNNNRYHPAQKPLGLLQRYLTVHSDENQTILDPFMGSGSTGVACVGMNRNFIGMELDDKYFKVAEERISKSERKVNARLW